MNISNCTKRAAFLLLMTTTVVYPQTETQPSNNPVQQEAPANGGMDLGDFQIPEDKLQELKATLAKIMDGMVTNIIKQTGRIEELLEDLALSVNNGVIGEKNKNELLQQIKNIRLVIAGIKQEAFVNVEPQTLQFLVLFNEVLMEHVSESINNGFTEIPPIQDRLATIYKRSAPMDLEQIEEKIFENEQKLAVLKNDSQNIGLAWYNKLTRRVNSLLLLAHRRRWDKHLMGATVLGTIAAHWLTLNSPFGMSKEEILLDRAERRKLEGEGKNVAAYESRLRQSAQDTLNAEAIRKKEEQEGIGLFTKGTRLFRRIFGHRPIEENGAIVPVYKKTYDFEYDKNGKVIIDKRTGRPRIDMDSERLVLDENGNPIEMNPVNWFGKMDIGVKLVAATFISAYLPAVKFVYGKNWASNFAEWVGKHIGSGYARLLGGVAAKKARDNKDDDDGMEPKHNFDDVVGFEHIKKMLKNILEYVKDPERFDRANIPPERGYLFTGLPGTGKSFVAEAFGGEIRKIFKEVGRDEDELGFYSFKAAFINEKGIGWLLDLAKKEAPCIIFIDEIDLLRLQRGNGNSELLSEFLSSMSGVLSKESGKQVILLAATNRPEHLDKALRRRGRFGKIIHFELPTLSERKAFFTKKLEPLIPDLSKIDIDKLAQETEDKTYEELAAMTNAAFQETKRLGEPLTQKHLEKSLDTEIRHIINKDIDISEQEQELIATHQAGHAAASVLLASRRELAGVTIKPFIAELKDESPYAQYYGPRKQKDVQYGKLFTKCSFDHLGLYTREEKIKQCKIALAGMISERIILGSCGHSYHTNDKQDALDMVKSLVFEGLHIKTMPRELQLEYFEKALARLKVFEKETEALLRDHKDALQEIADQLKKNKTLSARRVREIIVKHNGSQEAAAVAATIAPAAA